MHTIKIVDRTDPLATQAKQLVFEHSVASWAILFDGERWYHVERIAVALQDGNPVGMASLCPHGELNEPGEGPQIIGVWVLPELRGGGIGTALVHALAEESQRLYQQVPKMFAVTQSANALAKRLRGSNVDVEIVDTGGFGELP